MTAPRGRTRAWAALACAAWLSACGAILGIEPGTLGDAGDDGTVPQLDGAKHDATKGDAGAKREAATGHDATKRDATAPDVGPPPGDAQAPDAVTDANGPGSPDAPVFFDAPAPTPVDGGPVFVYVSTSMGSTASDCGSSTTPCLTITKGIAAAQSLVGDAGSAVVLVARGKYEESISLFSGVTLFGGLRWPDWTHPIIDGGTVITGVSPVTVTASNLVGGATMTDLVVVNDSPPQAGGSLYGVLAANDFDGGGQLLLENVVIVVGAAGDGVMGDAGAPGLAAGASCSPGGASMGPAGGAASGNPTVTVTGFVPASGGAGGAGGNGSTGTPGMQNCPEECASCGIAFGMCINKSQFGGRSGDCASGGPGGCGGGGGLGGAGGGGGGSSLALYVWNVPVIVQGGVLASGDGGNGGPGGPGGPGAPGGDPGAPGSSTCSTACGGSSCTLQDASMPFSGGGGGMGSPGGSGGPGAQGAGGSSYSVYYVGVMPELADVTYSQGKPGSGSVPGGVSNVGYP